MQAQAQCLVLLYLKSRSSFSQLVVRHEGARRRELGDQDRDAENRVRPRQTRLGQSPGNDPRNFCRDPHRSPSLLHRVTVGSLKAFGR